MVVFLHQDPVSLLLPLSCPVYRRILLPQILAQQCPIKAKVEYTVVVIMKLTVIKIKIGNTKIPGRRKNPVELIKQRSDFFNMMESHAAYNKVISTFQNIAPCSIKVLSLYIGKILSVDLCFENINHSPGNYQRLLWNGLPAATGGSIVLCHNQSPIHPYEKSAGFRLIWQLLYRLPALPVPAPCPMRMLLVKITPFNVHLDDSALLISLKVSEYHDSICTIKPQRISVRL